jgi:heat shock protein HslJ
MNSRTIAGVVGAAVLGCFCISSCRNGAGGPPHADAVYVIAGRSIELAAGVSELEAAPGSASRIVTRYFGAEARGDLNGDGRQDVVFVLTQETSGTGVFYYVVAALATESGYRGSQGLLLGDRIAPRTTEIAAGGIVTVSYAVRAPGESFAVTPSVAKSIRLRFDPDSLDFGEVAEGFEGEADPARMSLDMQTWTWIGAVEGDGTEIVPRSAGVFTLTFGPDGAFSTTTDCNRLGGTYAVSGDRLTFANLLATRMHCEGSQEGEFAGLLQRVATYRFDSRGRLILSLELDGGTVTFR